MTNSIAAFAASGGKKDTKSKLQKYLTLPPAIAYTRPLVFFEAMICGAVSRSTAQTIMHPANTMKTILQSQRSTSSTFTFAELLRPRNFKMLTRGAGAQFLLSVPHGACNFAVLETTRRLMAKAVDKWSPPTSKKDSGSSGSGFGPALDFFSSAIATVCCSVVSTPQMMITDNIMCGNYENLYGATKGLYRSKEGIKGFYTGWWPGLAGKIPSYGLTWVLFQQVKRMYLKITERQPTDLENTIMGCIGSAATVSIMIPMDTVKTRLVTMGSGGVQYKGIVDCARTVFREEGLSAFYKGLPPRLLSVVPMIGIQFGCYEFMKKLILHQRAELTPAFKRANPPQTRDKERAETLGRISQEVGVDDEQPFPVPGVGNTNGAK